MHANMANGWTASWYVCFVLLNLEVSGFEVSLGKLRLCVVQDLGFVDTVSSRFKISGLRFRGLDFEVWV